MKNISIEVKAPAAAKLHGLADSSSCTPRELSRALLAARFGAVIEARAPWRKRTKANLIDFLTFDAVRTWRVAVVDQDERLGVLLDIMADRQLVRQVKTGDRVQVWSWSRRSGGLMVEVVELGVEDFA